MFRRRSKNKSAKHHPSSSSTIITASRKLNLVYILHLHILQWVRGDLAASVAMVLIRNPISLICITIFSPSSFILISLSISINSCWLCAFSCLFVFHISTPKIHERNRQISTTTTILTNILRCFNAYVLAVCFLCLSQCEQKNFSIVYFAPSKSFSYFTCFNA